MRLLTDRADFFNDISEEIRLFLPSAELCPMLIWTGRTEI